MITINKDAQVNFKTDSRLLEKAKEVFAMNQLDLTAGFNLFLQNIAVKNELPILTEEELEREELFLQLQKEIQENQQAIEAGQGISLESVKEKYRI
ncbi:type II toxin-antitoxin system RelB/ParD family antitoxin [Streptococcus suis]|uniref:type II toxin-antitoxin system RelB/ParD family antitoxin n=1 Tax=Streptococcus suis TaxID=1307 RepID=UPI000C189944|nr:toxin-antitoxin system antitoxin subunit [Streptococcus suis]